jgi:hypothetical protein
MKSLVVLRFALLAFVPVLLGLPSMATELPTQWIALDTGHSITRLLRQPLNESHYFHQNVCTAAGDKVVISTLDGISILSLKTRAVELAKAKPRKTKSFSRSNHGASTENQALTC